MTEREKMTSGRIYDPSDPELCALRDKAALLCRDYNQTCDVPSDRARRAAILAELCPGCAADVWLRGPVYFDYGCFTMIGEGTFANFNFTVLDCAPVTIGKGVFFGPNCSLLTPLHPLVAEERAVADHGGREYDYEYAAPIVIGDGCWIASDVKVLPGVTIGGNCVIGAGSVVTHDVPAGMLAYGNPCRVVRPITEADSIYRKKELFAE